MFKKLGMIGLALAITLAVVSSAAADLKFYGGQMTGNIVIRPNQSLVNDGFTATGAQGLTASDSMNIATTTMYGVVADNEFLARSVSGALGKGIFERQVLASRDTDGDTFYKSSGLQTTVGSMGVTSYDQVMLDGNDGNIQFDARGADPTLTFTNVSQNAIDTTPSVGPSMTQTNIESCTMASPGAGATAPLSMITTGNAAGLIAIGSGITSSTQQNQEFSSLLRGCAGLYNGRMMKADTINMSSTHQMGTGSVVIE